MRISDWSADVGSSDVWAQQLLSNPPGVIDPLCPADWLRRWRLRRLDRWLNETNQSARLRQLHQARKRAEADLSKTYIRTIEQRTWREIGRASCRARVCQYV